MKIKNIKYSMFIIKMKMTVTDSNEGFFTKPENQFTLNGLVSDLNVVS